jgi:hypothetical protein
MKIPVFCRLDEDLKLRAEQAAEREDRSLSSLIARAVAAYLDATPAETTVRPMRKRSLAAAVPARTAAPSKRTAKALAR